MEDLAGRVLTAFLGSPLARPKGWSVTVQKPLVGMVDPDVPDLLAPIDLVQFAWEMHVTDFKVATSEWNRSRAAVAAEGLLLYRCLHRSITGDRFAWASSS